MTEHDSPTGSPPPKSNNETSGSAPMSAVEKVRQQMERLRAERANSGVDPIDSVTATPTPPGIRPISSPSLLNIAAQTSTDAARARAEDIDRQAAALQASRLIPDQPPEPTPPAESSSRFSVGRVLGGLFGGSGRGGGGGNSEPPGGPPLEQPDENPDNSNQRRRVEAGLKSSELRSDHLVTEVKARLENANFAVLKEYADLSPEQREREIDRTVTRLIELDKLPYDERATESIRVEMEGLFRQVIEYAAREKMENKSAALFEAEKAISIHLASVPENIRTEIQALDVLQDQKLVLAINRIVKRTRDGNPIPFTEGQIRDFDRRQQELDLMIDRRQQEIARSLGSGGMDFVTQYENLKTSLFAEVSREEMKTQTDLLRRINFERPVVAAVTERLTDENVSLNPNDTFMSVESVLRVAEAANILSQAAQYDPQEVQRAQNILDQAGGVAPNEAAVTEARAKKELLFKQAGEIGLLDPLTTSINSFYANVRQQWGSPDMERTLNAYEATLVNNVGSPRNWEQLRRYVERQGHDTSELDRYRGIETVFVMSAFDQMREMNIDMTAPTGHEADRPPLTRGKFEWNLLAQENALFEHRMETETFYEHQISLQLTGKNRAEIYRGVYNYLDHLTAAGVGDPQHMLQAIELLGNAIDTYGHEHMPQDERNELRRKVENQIYFYMGRYFGMIGHTESYISVMDRWADREGDKRMELVPEMEDGQVAYGIGVISQVNLYWRPEGHRGQVTGNKDAQDYLMKRIEEKMVDQIARKRIKGYSDPATRLRNLKKLSSVNNQAELEELFEEAQFASPKEEADARKQARKALSIARQFYDVMGETAELAEPSFVMRGIVEKEKKVGQATPRTTELVGYATEMGDLIPESQLARYLKKAIFDDALRIQQGGASPETALKQAVANARSIARKRWRRRPESEFRKAETDSMYYKAVMAVRKDGFTTVFNGEKFQDIVDLEKHPELDYNPNNFIGIDHPLRNMLANPDLRKLITKGKQPFLHRVVQVLSKFNVNLEMNKNQQVEMNNYVNAIEQSRKLHGDVIKIMYAEFANMDGTGIDYGPANRPLGIKRILKYRGYLMNNLNEKVAAAEYLIPWLPVLIGSFRKEVGAGNMFELISSSKIGAYDIYEIQRWLKRIKSVSGIKSLLEGGVDDNFKRNFGLFEKPFSTITQLWPLGDTPDHSYISAKIREGAVGEFMKSIQSRVEPVLAGLFGLIDDNRGAAGAGGAKLETTEFLNEYFDWMMFDDGAEQGTKGQPGYVKPWAAREQGGKARYNSQVYTVDGPGKSQRIEDLWKHSIGFILQDYNMKVKIRDEIARRINQGH